MTEVVPGDRTKLLQLKRAECSAIARSRKRKLCVLYAVATSADGLPQRSFADPDAPPTNPAESHFLEGSDILQGRKLNELNIPARPRTRSEYIQPPRPGGSFGPNENSHPPSPIVNKKKDASSISRSPVPLPSSSAPPRQGIDDGKTDTVSTVSPTTYPGPEHSLKSPQASWPSTQPANQSIRPDTPAVPAVSNDQSQQFRSTTTVKQASLPTGDQPNGTPKYPVSLPTALSGLPQTQVSQPLANKQRRLSQVDEPVNAPRQDLREGEPMEIDVTPVIKSTEIVSGVQPVPLPDTSRAIDGVSSVSSNTAAAQVAADVTSNKSSTGKIVPFAASEETNSMGMKDMASMRQSSQNGTLSGPTVAGTSESIPADKVRMQPISQPTHNVVKTPINGTNAAVDTPTHPPKTASSAICVPAPENNVAADAQQRAGSIPTSLQQLPRPPQPPQPPLHSMPTGDNGRGLAMPHVKSDQQQTDSDFRKETPSFNGNVAQNSVQGETTQKESLVAPVVSNGPFKVTPETPAEVKESQETQVAQEISRSPTQLGPDHRRTSSPTGVARQKPVSEILSAPPKLLDDAESGRTTSVIPGSQSSRKRSEVQRSKLQGKSNQSMVVFGKQSKGAMDSGKALVQSCSGAGQMASDDYFTPLFVQAFTSNSKWMRPLDQILHQAHKTLSTPDSYTHIFDNQACKVLKRVYHLQHHNKWSLRQPKRCPEPTRQPCHWDVLLKEMKWMRTDFREERKWKMAAARNMAYACAEWVSSSMEDRKVMQVNAIIPPFAPADSREVTAGFNHIQDPENQPTPDLIASAESDSPMEPDDEPQDGIIDTIAPSAIFALESDDVVFALHQSASADRLLEQLPMYGSPLEVPKFDITAPEYDPDASWRRPALPLSRFVEGRMELTPTEPPKKRSRYNYAQEDDEDDEVVFDQFGGSQPRLEPLNAHVALFRPENKSFRDRLHAGHQFRPPNEHTMPFQSFYESRSPSQWIQAEDDELKGLVREYSYNWSLISSILTSRSMFNSGAERRTPWECFERWVMLEGLPHDMQKTQYFKLWQGRIEASQQVIRQHQQQQAQQAQQQQQAGSNGPVTPLPKRRYNVPLKVERRRNQKHLTMIDAMRKLAKKRETALQKQQHNASLAAMRKTNETPQPRAPTKTPREYSIMRFERDQAMAERLAERMAQQQRHEAQRRAAIQRAQQGQVAQLAAAQNANQLSQNNPQMAASHPHAGIARVNAPNQISINAQGRPRMPMHTPNGTGTPNHMGGGLVPPMQMNGTSQVQMPSVNGQPRMAMPTTQPDLQLLIQAQQISEQQRRSVQMRQQQQQQQQQHQHQHQQQNQQQSHPNSQGSMPLQSSPPAMRAAAMNGINQKSYLSNAQAQAMVASFTSANGSGMSTPPGPGHAMTSQAGSPRPNTTIPQQTHQTHQTYVSQLQSIETHIRQAHPNMTQDVVRDMARQLLNTRHNNHNFAQSAMNAAAGGSGHAAAANGPHQYAQLLRAQQQQQAAAAAAAQAQQAQAQQGAQQHQRNSSGSATPTPSLPK